ncbi:hypothetical protein [Yoonia sp. BS5-3]|uniref:Uncharacterized protein n=1 Tax=Yoonia phaeophyticola TaxID=3137369 RepID=A0ABZ2V2Y6_9RHOB
MKNLTLTAGLFLAFGQASHANEIENVLRVFLDDEVRAWATDPVLIDAIRAQNLVTNSYTQDQIYAMDQEWKDAVDVAGADIIEGVVETPASEFLRTQVAASAGLVTEAFIMDARGLNVAASEATSDYWQGDEAKYTATYISGPDAVHFSDIEYDDSTQEYQAQMSFTITDPDTGAAIGAATVGVTASAF